MRCDIIYLEMKKPPRKKKSLPRLPMEAVLKLKSRPVSTKKGEKGYDRKRARQQMRKYSKAELFEEKG